MKPVRSILTAIIFSLFFSGCFARIDPRWKSVEDMALVGNDLKQRTCEIIKKRSLQMDSLKALFMLDMDAGAGSQPLRLSLAFKSPDMVRMEVIPPNMAVALFLAVSRKDYGLVLDMTSSKASTFNSSAGILPELIGVDLPVEDLAYILSARIPIRLVDRLCAGANTENDIFFKYAPDGAGVSIIDLRNGAFWTVNTQSGLLRTVLLRKGINGKAILATDFIEDDFMDPGNEFPREQTAVIANNLVTLKIQTVFSKLNASVKPQVFQVPVPASFKQKSYR